MHEPDVLRVLECAGLAEVERRFTPILARAFRNALHRIPLKYEDVAPVRILLSGYQDGFTTAVDCASGISTRVESSGWYNIVVLDYHDLQNKRDDERERVVAHEIAHVRLGHLRGGVQNYRKVEDEADALATEWGFPAVQP